MLNLKNISRSAPNAGNNLDQLLDKHVDGLNQVLGPSKTKKDLKHTGAIPKKGVQQQPKPQVQGSEIVDDVLYISGPVKLANTEKKVENSNPSIRAFPLIPSDKFDPESTLMRNAKKFDLQQQRQQQGEDVSKMMQPPAGAIPRGSNRADDEMHVLMTRFPKQKFSEYKKGVGVNKS